MGFAVASIGDVKSSTEPASEMRARVDFSIDVTIRFEGLTSPATQQLSGGFERWEGI
jgi:hypothetical protein